tara:strand:- start:131 stop:577 length:447 start_codon:yes stop_codon:yes gene_type:complete
MPLIFLAKTEANIKQQSEEAPKGVRKLDKREMLKFLGASDEYLDARDAGVRFEEKPPDWRDIEESISSSQLGDLEQVIGKKLNTYDINSILENPTMPLSKLKHENLKEEDLMKGSSFIVWDPKSQSRYLANTTGADTYIRMWTGIDYD